MRIASFCLVIAACGAPTPYFEESTVAYSSSATSNKNCPFKVDTSQVIGKTYRCGVLHTPEVHATPNKLIEVPALIFVGKPTGIPVINLAGGPGQSWANLGLDKFMASDTTRFGEDVIFIEQRGAGLSVPRLDCPQQLSTQSDADYLSACAASLTKAKVNVPAYNTVELAGDIDTFVAALKYKKVTLDGVSYGTAWAEEVMRDYPNILAGSLIDSVLSPASPPWGNGAVLTDGAFTALFQACAANSDCATAFGDLETMMIDDLNTLTQLDKNHHSLPVNDGVAGDAISADDFWSVSFTLLATDNTDLPLWIKQVHDAITAGSLTVSDAVSGDVSNDQAAVASDPLGQYFSIMCSYNQTVTVEESLQATLKVRTAFQKYLDRSSILQDCSAWTSQTFPASKFTPVTTSVPTLILSGDLDPLTPPAWATEVATALPNATLVQVPGVGHDVSNIVDPCLNTLERSFYIDPAKEDPSCAGGIAVAFTLPDQQTARDIDVPGLMHMHRAGTLHDRIPHYGFARTPRVDSTGFRKWREAW